MMDMDVEPGIAGETLFRAAKRRRCSKGRPMSAEEESSDQGGDVEMQDGPVRVGSAVASDPLRLHRNRMRRGGIVFSTSTARSSQPSPPPTEVATMDPQRKALESISDRFAPYSGQVVDVNKHMVAYIESEMAKRRLGRVPPHLGDVNTSNSDHDTNSHAQAGTKALQRQPASIGKIHEIDLGNDAARRNKERTERAIRRARGEDVPAEEPAVVKKPRLGRNGKPRRGPKPRDVEDVKRDQLVEQVLHESRLEIYDKPGSSNQLERTRDGQRGAVTAAAAAVGKQGKGKAEEEKEEEGEEEEEELGTDERVAAQFRQEFMEAMQARHRHRAATGQAKQQARKARQAAAGKQGEPQTSRGPKLGGSRSARAAMRAQQQQEKAAATATTGGGGGGGGGAGKK